MFLFDASSHRRYPEYVFLKTLSDIR